MSKRLHPEAHRVEVQWDDSTIPAGGWILHADVIDKDYRRLQVRCLSVGLLIANDKHGIALASSVHGRDVAGVTIIPRGQIQQGPATPMTKEERRFDLALIAFCIVVTLRLLMLAFPK